MVLFFKNDVVIIYEILMDGALKIKARKCACNDLPRVQIDNNIIFILYLACVNLGYSSHYLRIFWQGPQGFTTLRLSTTR